jgi:Flp pilus assembly protein TadB
VNQQGPVQSLSQRLWSLALSILGLVIVANLAWAMLRPLLPVVAVVGILVLGVSVWNRWRWR